MLSVFVSIQKLCITQATIYYLQSVVDGLENCFQKKMKKKLSIKDKYLFFCVPFEYSFDWTRFIIKQNPKKAFKELVDGDFFSFTYYKKPPTQHSDLNNLNKLLSLLCVVAQSI